MREFSFSRPKSGIFEKEYCQRLLTVPITILGCRGMALPDGEGVPVALRMRCQDYSSVRVRDSAAYFLHNREYLLSESITPFPLKKNVCNDNEVIPFPGMRTIFMSFSLSSA